DFYNLLNANPIRPDGQDRIGIQQVVKIRGRLDLPPLGDVDIFSHPEVELIVTAKREKSLWRNHLDFIRGISGKSRVAVRVGKELDTGTCAGRRSAASVGVSSLQRDGGQVLLIGAELDLPPGQRVNGDHLELQILIPRRKYAARGGIVHQWGNVSLNRADVRRIVIVEFEN